MAAGGVFRFDPPLPQHAPAVPPDTRGAELFAFEVTQVLVTGLESWPAQRARASAAAWLTAPYDPIPRKPVQGMGQWYDLLGWAALRAFGVDEAPFLNLASRFAPIPAWRVAHFGLAVWQPAAMRPPRLRVAAAIYGDGPPPEPPSASVPSRAARAWAALGF